MRLTILQEILKRGLALISRIPSKNITLPILNNVLLRVEKNFLNLAATDLEVGVNLWALAKTEGEGALVLPLQTFSGLVGFLPNKPIDLEVKDLTLNIKCEDYQSAIKCLDAEDFPAIPAPSNLESLRISGSLFCQGLGQIAGIPVPSSSRPEISGIYLSFQKNLIKMAATDSFRLGEKTLPLKEQNLTKPYSAVISQHAAREIINIFGEEAEIKICFSPNQILLESLMAETNHPKVQMVCRLIEGEFPNYEAIIPQKYETEAVLLKKEFLNQVKAAGVFSGKTSEIKMKINPVKKELEILSQSQEAGEFASRLAAQAKGRELEIAFNHRFLLDGILSIDNEDEVVLSFSGQDGPAVIKSINASDYFYILMPIKKN